MKIIEVIYATFAVAKRKPEKKSRLKSKGVNCNKKYYKIPNYSKPYDPNDFLCHPILERN